MMTEEEDECCGIAYCWLDPGGCECLRKKEISFHVAQLRHLYAHLKRMELDGLADGLLSPAIQCIEKIMREGEDR